MADLTHALAELRRLDQPTPIKHPLPTEADVDAVQDAIGRPIPDDVRQYLLKASNVFVGQLSPAHLRPGSQDYLPSLFEAAAQWQMPTELFPICYDNADFYCVHPDGRIVYWTHDGGQLTGEEWPDLATWILECWIGRAVDFRTPVLSVRDLVVEIPTRHGILKPVDGVSYDIMPGEILGVVGESGAGKSMTGNAVIGLLDRPARIAEGEIYLNHERIDNLSLHELRKYRGKQIGMVFQDPLTSLNPLLPIGDQLTETIQEHLGVSRSEAEGRAVAALEEVGIPAAKERINSYPHEFSGGMRQRVVIALALCAEPSLVIADEPTTALDVSVQAQITSLLKRLCRERGMAVMLVTHDMGVIAETADRVAVMYAGKLAELGPVRDVIGAPRHPYTDGLMGSTPLASKGKDRLHQIPGNMPRLGQLPDGCAFHPRCPYTQDKCRENPGPRLKTTDGRAACWFPLDGAVAAKGVA